MSTNERLLTIVQQCRSENGDAFLRRADQFVPRLTGQAPDLFGEIKALGRAFEIGSADRIARSADPDSEVEAISREIAESEKLSFRCVQIAVAVARHIGPLGGALPPAAGDDWAGDSVVVGAPVAGPAHTAPPIAAHAPHTVHRTSADEEGHDEDEDEDEDEPFWKNKWVLGGGAAVLVFMFYSAQSPAPPGSQQPQQPQGGVQQPQAPAGNQPAPGPNGQAPPGGGGQQGQNAPPLLNNGQGQVPTLRLERTPDGNFGIVFSIMTQNGPAPAFVMVPADWNTIPGFVGFWPSGTPNFSAPPATVGGAPFQFFNNQGQPVRYMNPQWQQDNIGLGEICVSFETAQQAQDVTVQGSTMCIRDGSCNQAAGCGLVQ